MISSAGIVHRGCFIGWLKKVTSAERDSSGMVVRGGMPLRGTGVDVLGGNSVRGMSVRGPGNAEDYDL